MNLRKRCPVYADGEELRDRLSDSIAVGRRSVTFPENPVKDSLRRLRFCLWLCSSEQAGCCRNHKTIA
jgi:hypothetical protein